MLEAPTYGTALRTIWKNDGFVPCVFAMLASWVVRLLPFERRLKVYEDRTLDRKEAVEWVTESTDELIPVLEALSVGGILLLGEKDGLRYAKRDFIQIVRKAAFLRSSRGADATVLHLILDDLQHNP